MYGDIAMKVLPFKKKEAIDINLELVDNLREIRTALKQLKIEETQVIKEMNENISDDNFIYNINDLPIARLSISHPDKFDSKSFKEQQPEVYDSYLKTGERRTWYIL